MEQKMPLLNKHELVTDEKWGKKTNARAEVTLRTNPLYNPFREIVCTQMSAEGGVDAKGENSM